METPYWRQQTDSKPLFEHIEWSKPERKDQAGKLLVVGGNKLGFNAIAEAYQTALSTGVGEVRIIIPDSLKPVVPKTILDVMFAPSTPSGSISQESLPQLQAASQWANATVLIGDAGRNAETALVYEAFITSYSGQLTITRDAIDLIKNNPRLLTEREDTLIVASFAQLQKLFGGVYYPKILTFNMQLLQLVDTLHKFTITYPATIMTLHKDVLVIAHSGKVITHPWTEPMAIWRGQIAIQAACYWLWNPDKPLDAVAASILSK